MSRNVRLGAADTLAKLSAQGRKTKNLLYMANQSTSDSIVESLKLHKDYPKHTCHVIEINPGPGVFTRSIFNAIQPRHHILLDKIGNFQDSLQALSATSSGRLRWTDLDGWKWASYPKLLVPRSHQYTSPSHDDSADRLTIPYVEPPTINPHLLFIGHIPQARLGHALVVQFISLLGDRSWIFQYGRVRMLLWVDTGFVEHMNYLKGRASSLKIICNILTNMRSIATPDPTLIMDPDQLPPYAIDPTLDILPSKANKSDLTLVEILPRQVNALGDAPFDEFNYVLRRVNTLHSTPIGEALKVLGPGAERLLDTLPHINPSTLVEQLPTSAFAELINVYTKWPFKPRNIFEEWTEDLERETKPLAQTY